LVNPLIQKWHGKVLFPIFFGGVTLIFFCLKKLHNKCVEILRHIVPRILCFFHGSVWSNIFVRFEKIFSSFTFFCYNRLIRVVMCNARIRTQSFFSLSNPLFLSGWTEQTLRSASRLRGRMCQQAHYLRRTLRHFGDDIIWISHKSYRVSDVTSLCHHRF